MGVIIDLLLVLVIALFVVLCYKKGFIATFVSMFGTVISGVVAFALSKPVASFIYSNFMEKPIYTALESTFTAKAPDMSNVDSVVKSIADSLPSFMSGTAQNISDSIKGEVAGKLQSGADALLHTVQDNVIKPLALKFVGIFAIIILFLLCLIVVRLLSRPLKKLVNLPLIGPANKILGAVIGLIQGIIAAAVIAAVLSLIVPLTVHGLWIFTQENIDKSLIFGLAKSIRL
ncbi:MAG: CvpA family protein [Oscillospiraceae bacterium]|jgi:uncharacterized membrane protein required for colicin V production|nr:CvpA family protein [Oscillospiraceae bacterium]